MGVFISSMSGGTSQREKARRWLMLLNRPIKKECNRRRWCLRLRLRAVLRLMLRKVKIRSKIRKIPLISSNLRYMNLLSVIDAKLLAIFLGSVGEGDSRIGQSKETLV
jgi:hypothetical protein